MATDLPYPLPNPRPCGCNGPAMRVYGQTEKAEASGQMSGFARGAVALGGIVAVFVAMSLIIPPEKEKPTVFLPAKPRKPYLPQ